MVVIRGIIVGLSLLVALSLLRRGSVALGVLVGSLALARGWMLITMSRRRRELGGFAGRRMRR